MLLPPASGTYSEMGAIFQVAISFSIQRKLGGGGDEKEVWVYLTKRNSISQIPFFHFEMDQSILAPFHFHLAALRQVFRSLIVEWIKARSTCKSLNMTFPLNQNQSPQSHSPCLPLYPNLMKSALRRWVSKDSCSSPEESFKTHLHPATVRGWRTKVEVHLWSVGAERASDT